MKVNNAKNYLINGKCKINEKDYFYHSWMEAVAEDGKTKVFDYTNNLIIDKKDYYRLFEAITINRTESITLMEVLEMLYMFNLALGPLELGYFSQQIKRDLEKNKFLIKNKEAN